MKNTLLTICICVSAIFTGCKNQVDVSKAIIGDWTIVEADGIAVETGFETPSISFKEDGNVYGNTSINKFDLCSLFNKYFRAGEVEINPNDKLQLDKTLKCTRTDFSFRVPSYEQQIKDMREWVDAHPSLYPHYNVK